MPTLLELYETIGGQLLPAAATRNMARQAVGAVVTDSRRVEPGNVFWALPGTTHDGNDFAAEAFRLGAAGAVVSRTVEPPSKCWAIRVSDPQRALWQWAGHYRRRFSGTVIAVTGSVGKSTTRQMIHTVLQTRLQGTASPKNYNNHVGLPLSMLQIEPHHDYAVLELGASRPGEIASLAQLCVPKVGVITHIGDAHLGGFGSRQAIAEAKSELLAALPFSGRALLGDDPWLRGLARRCPAEITWVGTAPECDFVAAELRSGPGKLEFRLGDCRFQVPVWGSHHVTAALIAIAAGRMMGFDLPKIAAALAGFQPLPMRCEVLEVRGATIINDAYNANPTAMRAALELLRDFDTAGRRIVVCGDMAELGEAAGTLHWQVGRQVVTVCGADLLIACGHYARHVVTAARAAGMPNNRTIPCNTIEEALPYLGQGIMPGDAVLVKGSRVMAMERVVEALQHYPRRRTA